jgi:hypothetical protein
MLEVDGAIWSQQEGATAHTARGTWEYATAVFVGTVTSHSSGIAWTARSPDLSVPEHSLWEHVMAKPHVLEELQEHVRDEIRYTDRGLLQEVMVNF